MEALKLPDQRELEYTSQVLAEKFGNEIARMAGNSHSSDLTLANLVAAKLLQMFSGNGVSH